MSIALLIASVAAVLVSPTGLIIPSERGYVHALFSGSNNDNSYDMAGNLGANIIYYDNHDQIIEDPYEIGWD